MNKNNYLQKITIATECFFMTWALMKACSLDTGSILTLLFFGCLYLLIRFVKQMESEYIKEDKIGRLKGTALTLALVFALVMEFVYGKDYCLDFENLLFKGLIIAATFAGIALTAYFAIMAVYLLIELKGIYFFQISSKTLEVVTEGAQTGTEVTKGAQTGTEVTKDAQTGTNVTEGAQTGVGITTDAAFTLKQGPGRILRSYIRLFIISSLIIFLCYLPYFLFQYPGIMTPDSIVQLEQVWGMTSYSNHHPWVHTMLIKFWYDLGFTISGNVYTGIAFYTVFQMLIMAAAGGYSLSTLAKLGFRKGILIVVLAFYALIPFNGAFAVTVWKDILFACAVLCMVNALVKIILKKQVKADYIILFIAAFWTCVGRSNGWYGMLVAAPFICIYLSKKKKKLPAGLVLGAILLTAVVKWPLMNAFEVKQPDFVESISIPLQQVANVLYKDRQLTSKQREMIEQVIDTSYIKELYEPTFADNIKELARSGHPEWLEAHKVDYLKLYLELGMEYPWDYLEAYINQTEGFYAPQSFELVGNVQGISPNQYNLVTQPLIGGAIVTKIHEILIKLESVIPLYGILAAIGSLFWLVMASFGLEISRKGNLWIVYVPVLSLMLSVLIATPVACDMRYYYFMALSLPMLLLMPIFTTVTAKNFSKA